MNKTLLSTIIVTCLSISAMAQPTATYYRNAHGKTGAELKSALFQIIKNPSVIHYDSLWYAYNISDPRNIDGQDIIWDMYSNISRYPLYTYPHGTGAGNTEGVKGIQREHSMPKKWFNPTDAPASGSKTYQDVRPMYSDIVHVIPTDAVCNNNRSDLCYAEVAEGQADWESEGGFSKKSKQGGCSTPEWAEQVANPTKTRVFEPNDEYKGDLARIYFYMATCYEPGYFSWVPVRDADKKKTGEIGLLSENHCGTWTSDMFDLGSEDAAEPFAPWAIDMLMKWAKNDPVSDKERARNEVIWQLQGNRNPFVDYEGLEDYIWGDKQEVPFDYGGEMTEEPTSDNCDVVLNNATFGVDWSGTDTENFRDFWERTPLSIEQNGVTITFNYGMEGKCLYADENEIRLYNYNTLTLNAHNNELVKVEFTIPGNNHDKKYLVSSVGEIDNNVWTGNATEVIFASNYVSSTKSGQVTINYYLELSNMSITVANPTGIEQMAAERVYDDRTYTLTGIVVEGPLQPGIYIRNGRKFVVK